MYEKEVLVGWEKDLNYSINDVIGHKNEEEDDRRRLQLRRQKSGKIWRKNNQEAILLLLFPPRQEEEEEKVEALKSFSPAEGKWSSESLLRFSPPAIAL